MSSTTAISAWALGLSLIGLVWNVQSWRHSGARIKVRALFTGSTLRLTIANAGRTPDAVTHVFLGGMSAGQGLNLSEKLPLPVKVETASPAEFDVDLTSAESALLVRAQLGFESVHVCLGSLRTVRSDVIPHGRLHPAASWRLLRRPGVWRRCAPLAGAVLALAAATVPPQNVDAARTGLCLIMLAGGLAVYATQFRRQRFFRARMERALTLVGLATALGVAGSGGSRGSSSLPGASQLALLVLVTLGLAFAIPGAIAAALTEATRVGLFLRNLRGRRRRAAYQIR